MSERPGARTDGRSEPELWYVAANAQATASAMTAASPIIRSAGLAFMNIPTEA